MSAKYHDIDGNPCTLEQLCTASPGWASSTIEHVTKELHAIARELQRIRVGIGTSQSHEVSDWLEPLFDAERRLEGLVVDDE